MGQFSNVLLAIDKAHTVLQGIAYQIYSWNQAHCRWLSEWLVMVSCCGEWLI